MVDSGISENFATDDDEWLSVLTMSRQSKSGSQRRRSKRKNLFPRRAPSVIVPEKERNIPPIPSDITIDAPYRFPQKLNQCLRSPLTLYELASKVVDGFRFPEALSWSVNQVADWLDYELGFPQYRECIYDNHINGSRLLMLEDPSKATCVNIHHFDHLLKITSHIRKLFGTHFVRFVRSINLPPRKLLTHWTWFKSRTGPTWGIRQNWTMSDLFRAMKILDPKPLYLDHWDLVWYRKPEYPRTKFGRIGKAVTKPIPHYIPPQSKVKYPPSPREILVPRKFRFDVGIRDSQQFIWVEESVPQIQKKPIIANITARVYPRPINPSHFKGAEFLLAKRKMPKQKFFIY